MTHEAKSGHISTDTDQIRKRIVQIFIESSGAFVSGSTLADSLQVTRTAVWKHIRALEELGFQFESVHGTGYRLLQYPDLLLEPLLRPLLKEGLALGRCVHWFPEVDSTNQIAMGLALGGAPHGTVVTALRQTGGHGRRKKPWFSPKGGLWISVILQKPFPLRNAPELTLLASVALRRALIATAGIRPSIKWPNDLLLQGEKLSGILAEIRSDGESVEHAVVGIGVNTNIPTKEFPEELTNRATSILGHTNQPVSHRELAARLLSEFENLFENLLCGQGFPTVSEEWRQASSTLGTRIQVQTPLGLVVGTAETIDNQGILYVRQTSGEIVQIHSGEILFD